MVMMALTELTFVSERKKKKELPPSHPILNVPLAPAVMIHYAYSLLYPPGNRGVCSWDDDVVSVV